MTNLELGRDDFQDSPPLAPPRNYVSIARTVCSGVGLLIVVLGLILGLDLFDRIIDGLRDPTLHEGTIAAWAESIGGDGLSVQVGSSSVPFDRVLAVLFLVLGVAILVHLSLVFMTAGARMISFAAGDEEVKRYLKVTLAQIRNEARQSSSS